MKLDKSLDHLFFWGGPFSNFDNTVGKINYKGLNFVTSEQIFMWEKAKFFGDEDSAKMILETGQNPKIAKSLGRKVKNYNDTEWNKVRQEKMMGALKSKFGLVYYRNILLDTGDKILVEASPLDKIWGIGFDSTNALRNIDKWGQNLLGECLMDIREQIREEKS